MAVEGVGSFEQGPGGAFGRRHTWLPPRPMTGSLALPPPPAVVEGRRLLWRDTSLALIGIALLGAVLLAGFGRSEAARPAEVPAQAAAATEAPPLPGHAAPDAAWPESLP